MKFFLMILRSFLIWVTWGQKTRLVSPNMDAPASIAFEVGQDVCPSNFSDMGHLGIKSRSHELKIEILNTLDTTVSVQTSWKLVREILFVIIWPRSNMGHLG